MKLLSHVFLAAALWALMSPDSCSAAAAVDYDTTRVREVRPVKKSAAETLADIPGEILKLPVYTFQFAARTLATNPPVSSSFSLIRFPKHKKALTPVVGFSTRAGLKFGFKMRFLNSPRSKTRFRFKSYYSTNDYQLYRLRFTSPDFISSRVGLNVRAQYRKETRQSFYGIGKTSLESNEVNITSENSLVEAQIPVRVGRSVNVSLFARGQITNVFDGRDPDLEGRVEMIRKDSTLKVQFEQFDPLRHIDFGLSLELDRRNSASRPTSGSYFLGNYQRVIGVGLSDGRNFDMFSIEFQRFFHIWRRRVLAIRTFVSRTDAVGANDKAIPFYLASRLGGHSALRGYTTGRFIDNDAAYVSAEWRYPLYEHIDAFLFWDEGRVFNDITKQAVFENWRNSLGFGLRVWDKKSALAVIQIAHSDESTRFYFELGATW